MKTFEFSYENIQMKPVVIFSDGLPGRQSENIHYHYTLAICSTISFIWKSENKLESMLVRKRKGETERMREGNDALSWTSDPLFINLCPVTAGCNNTHGCAESEHPNTPTHSPVIHTTHNPVR